MLRILEVCTESAPAYALVFRRAQLINKMHPHLLRADILCSEGREVQQMRAQGMTVRVADIHRSLNPYKLLQSANNLLRILNRHSYDVIHLHFGVPGLVGRFLAIFIRQLTWVYQSHGYSISANTSRSGRFIYLSIERLLRHTVTFALLQSQEDMAIAGKYNLLTARQMIYLGNGVDIKRFSPSGTALTEPDSNKLIFGMVARFEPIKNYQLLIDAIKYLRLQSTNFKVYMIGQGEQKQLISAQIAAHELHDLVEIHAYRQDMPAFYRQIDIGILTSFGEGLPRALLEPMACGRPVLCTDVKGSREAVIDGKTGFILPLGKPEQLAAKMHWCIENRDALPALGAAARRHVMDNFSEQAVIERLSDVYLRCYQRHYADSKLETQA
jgi:glycosyltransferase involved in cell wall biosynthesis